MCFIQTHSDYVQHGFGTFYFADATCIAFQSLYDNYNGLQDEFVEYWEQLATYFKSNANVIGYELISK